MVYDTCKSIMSSSFGDHENHLERCRSRVPPKRELQGPRPPPLKVIKDSSCTKISSKKPTAVIAAIDDYNSSPRQLIGTRRCNINNRRRPPLVIHLKSPKIIHTRPQDFMILVQQLTGKCGSSSQSSSVDDQESKENMITTVKDIKEDDNDDQFSFLQLSASNNGSNTTTVSSLRTSNILSPASLFGTTSGFMSSPNVAACTNSNWHDFIGSSILR